MSQSSICITIKLFAAYQEAYGVSELTKQLPTQTTAVEVLDILIKEHPILEKWREITRFGVNLRFIEGGTILKDGDELVLIPPVSGG